MADLFLFLQNEEGAKRGDESESEGEGEAALAEAAALRAADQQEVFSELFSLLFLACHPSVFAHFL